MSGSAAVEIVADASAIGRLVFNQSVEVADIVSAGRVIAPSLMLLELANALITQVCYGGLDPDCADALLGNVLRLPISYVSTRRLTRDAKDLGLELGLSAYDAAYVALAGKRDISLLTADRRLAAVYPRAVLVT